MRRRIFTYWVNDTGRSVPAYIQLCLQTWFEHMPDLELVIINYANLHEWTGDVIDYKRFLLLPPSMQKDIVSMLTLVRHGGIFMDADTIVTKDIFQEAEKIPPDKLAMFGNASGFHHAILISQLPNNKFISTAADIAVERLNGIIEEGDSLQWDYFCNSISNSVYKDEALRDCLQILDRTETGNILESHYFLGSAPGEQYLSFYFGNHDIDLDEALSKVKFGAISLHNWWTPEEYKKLTLEQVVESDTMLSRILKHALVGFL